MHASYKKSKSQYSTEQDIINFKQSRAEYRKAVREAKQEAWTKFCSAESNPFGKTKKFAFDRFLDLSLQVMPDMGVAPHSRLDILSRITTSLFRPSQHFPHFLLTTTLNNQPLFTQKELRKAIFSFNQNKAPGPDQIDHRMIRAIYLKFPTLILEMYNSLLFLNYFPLAWKEGELVYFRKEGKPLNLPSSFRPITLLPIFGKNFEKLLLQRIQHFLSISGLLSGLQHGFTERRSTETALETLLSLIELNKKNNQYTSLISIDFTGAFDNLPYSKSLLSFLKLKLPIQYLNILASFLEGTGRLGITLLLPITLHEVVPRGHVWVPSYGLHFWRLF